MTTEPPEIDLDQVQQLANHYTQITTTEGMWLTKYDHDMVYKMAALFPALLTRVRDLQQQIIILQQDARQADMDCDNAITQACRQELNDAADHVETFWGIKLIAVELRVRAAQVGQQAAPETPIADEFTLGRWWQVRLDSDNSP